MALSMVLPPRPMTGASAQRSGAALRHSRTRRAPAVCLLAWQVWRRARHWRRRHLRLAAGRWALRPKHRRRRHLWRRHLRRRPEHRRRHLRWPREAWLHRRRAAGASRLQQPQPRPPDQRIASQQRSQNIEPQHSPVTLAGTRSEPSSSLGYPFCCSSRRYDQPSQFGTAHSDLPVRRAASVRPDAPWAAGVAAAAAAAASWLAAALPAEAGGSTAAEAARQACHQAAPAPRAPAAAAG
jgi:hypothetical protein